MADPIFSDEACPNIYGFDLIYMLAASSILISLEMNKNLAKGEIIVSRLKLLSIAIWNSGY